MLPGDRIILAGRFSETAASAARRHCFWSGRARTDDVDPAARCQSDEPVLAWYRPDGSFSTARIVAHGDFAFLSGAVATADGGVVMTGSYGGHIVLGPLDSNPVTYTKPGPAFIDNIGTSDVFVAAFCLDSRELRTWIT